MRIRQHVNPLKASLLVARAARLELPAGREIEVEIGCAEAQFLFERAAKDPARVEVGLEIREELVGPVNRKAKELGVDVRAVFCNVNVELGRLFAPGSVARFFVNFPDPWFKRRQHKRRVMDDELAEACWRALRPGGELFFQSDVFDLTLDALAVLEARPDRLENLAGEWSFWKRGNPYGVRSRREVGCAEEGAPVWRMLYRKVG